MTAKTKFLTKARFSKAVEQMVAEKKISYIDAIVLVCQKTNIDTADVRKFLTTVIKDKVKAEAVELNLVQSDENQLPI